MPADIKPAPKRRPWFQVHLSTCVILMFVAGGLLWGNVMERGLGQLGIQENGSFMTMGKGRGWPLLFGVWVERDRGSCEEYRQDYVSSDVTGGSDSAAGGVSSLDSLAPGALLLDVLVALAVLALTGFLCEWPIRRRQRAG